MVENQTGDNLQNKEPGVDDKNIIHDLRAPHNGLIVTYGTYDLSLNHIHGFQNSMFKDSWNLYFYLEENLVFILKL